MLKSYASRKEIEDGQEVREKGGGVKDGKHLLDVSNY